VIALFSDHNRNTDVIPLHEELSHLLPQGGMDVSQLPMGTARSWSGSPVSPGLATEQFVAQQMQEELTDDDRSLPPYSVTGYFRPDCGPSRSFYPTFRRVVDQLHTEALPRDFRVMRVNRSHPAGVPKLVWCFDGKVLNHPITSTRDPDELQFLLYATYGVVAPLYQQLHSQMQRRGCHVVTLAEFQRQVANSSRLQALYRHMQALHKETFAKHWVQWFRERLSHLLFQAAFRRCTMSRGGRIPCVPGSLESFRRQGYKVMTVG
jgi:hypothetical protein